jgi:hypothetical protein
MSDYVIAQVTPGLVSPPGLHVCSPSGRVSVIVACTTPSREAGLRLTSRLSGVEVWVHGEASHREIFRLNDEARL